MTPVTLRFFEQSWPEGEYRLFQLGFVVDDLVACRRRSGRTVFGIGPFHVLPPFDVPCTYRGADTRIDMQIAVAQAGPVQIELIHQRDDRPSVYRELAERHGFGVHQLCTVAADYDGKKAYYEAARVPARLRDRVVDTAHRVLRHLRRLRLLHRGRRAGPGFLSSLEAIARTCAEWDGTDPVRLLTRDGYRTP